MKPVIPLAIAGASIAIGEVVSEINDGVPPLEALQSPVRAITTAVASVAAIDPVRRNYGAMATREQVEAWERKVGRNPSMRSGINQVPRVSTSPYIDPAHPYDLRGFARLAGEGAEVGIKGGYILAVLLSVETWAGFPGRGAASRIACYNNNPGNFKLSRAQALAPSTPRCWFLVDNIRSLDFYPAFGDMREGVRAWSSATFGNSRYNARVPGKKTCLESLRDGDIHGFCEAIGRAGYAASYRASRNALDARAMLLTRVGRFQRMAGPSALDAGVIDYNG